MEIGMNNTSIIDFSEYSFWELVKLSMSIDSECFKRIWWIIIVILMILIVVIKIYNFKTK